MQSVRLDEKKSEKDFMVAGLIWSYWSYFLDFIGFNTIFHQNIYVLYHLSWMSNR